jgi:hypothetical protein
VVVGTGVGVKLPMGDGGGVSMRRPWKYRRTYGVVVGIGVGIRLPTGDGGGVSIGRPLK